MWKPEDNGQCSESRESMEVMASDGPMDIPDEDLMDIATPENLSYHDPMEVDDSIDPRLRIALRPSHGSLDSRTELRQRSSPNIISWVTEQQLFSGLRSDKRVVQRRPHTAQEGQRRDPAEYERAVDEIKKIRRQCGM